MSKADKILDDELDPEDLDPSPRGGAKGRNTDPKKTTGGPFLQGLGERVGIAGLVLFTAVAALGAAGCDKVTGHPAPRPPHTEDAPDSDYMCGYDGNQLCPSTPPPVRASCDEPAAWCGGVGEAVQR